MNTEQMFLKNPYECPVCYSRFYLEKGYVNHKCGRKNIEMHRKLVQKIYKINSNNSRLMIKNHFNGGRRK